MGIIGSQLHIIPPLLQFPKMTHNQLIYNLLIGNKRDKIPPFCLLTRHHARHLITKKCKNDGHYKLIRMKKFIKVTKKHAREDNFGVERRRNWNIRYTIVILDKLR